MGLRKWIKDLEFENFVEYLSLLDFEIASTQVWLSYSFLYQIFHTPIKVHRFFLLWDLKNRVRILDLEVLWEL